MFALWNMEELIRIEFEVDVAQRIDCKRDGCEFDSQSFFLISSLSYQDKAWRSVPQRVIRKFDEKWRTEMVTR